MREKTFGYGQCVPGDRKLKIAVYERAVAFNRRHRAKRQHKGPLTRATLEVLRALLWNFHNAITGRCFPSYEAIADKAGCARSTVALAVKALESARILTWCHRLIRISHRIFRTSNGYRFLPPSENPAGHENLGVSKSLTSIRQGSFRDRTAHLSYVPPIRSVERQIDLLKQRQLSVEAGLRASYEAKRAR
jgi:hypothetical protein